MKLLIFLFTFFMFTVLAGKSFAAPGDVEGVCLGYGFSISTYMRNFEMINRDSQNSSVTSEFITGKIREYGLFGNGSILAGYINIENIEDLMLSDESETGYFIINFRTEDVKQGLSKENVIAEITKITKGFEEITFKPFDRSKEVISDLMKPCSELQSFK